MEASRKPLAKVEGRKRMRLSGLTVVWRGTPSLDDWVAYIANGTKSKKLILADHASERKVKGLLTRIQGMSKIAEAPEMRARLIQANMEPATGVKSTRQRT